MTKGKNINISITEGKEEGREDTGNSVAGLLRRKNGRRNSSVQESGKEWREVSRRVRKKWSQSERV